MIRCSRTIQSLFNRRLFSAKSLSTSSFYPKSTPRRVLNGVLKFGSYSALFTCAATAGVTYAYTVGELSAKFQRLVDFTEARFPGRYTLGPLEIQGKEGLTIESATTDQKHYLDNYSLPLLNEIAVQEGLNIEYATPDPKHSPPPLEFKSPFINKVVTVLGEMLLFYLNSRLVIQILFKECFSPRPEKLLPDTDRPDVYTLVLDLNETLIHSDWLVDFNRGEHTFKRPGFHAFLDHVHAYGYEVVLYTDMSIIDVLPIYLSLRNRKSFNHVLTLGSTVSDQDWESYRDLSRLNRDPARILYVSAHALENCLQPENCVEIMPWKKEEMDDSTLIDLIPFLKAVSHEKPNDVRQSISIFNGKKAKLAKSTLEGTDGA